MFLIHVDFLYNKIIMIFISLLPNSVTVYLSLPSLFSTPLSSVLCVQDERRSSFLTTLSGDKWRSLYLAYCLSVLLQLYKYAAIRFFTAPSGTTVNSFTTVVGQEQNNNIRLLEITKQQKIQFSVRGLKAFQQFFSSD